MAKRTYDQKRPLISFRVDADVYAEVERLAVKEDIHVSTAAEQVFLAGLTGRALTNAQASAAAIRRAAQKANQRVWKALRELAEEEERGSD